MRQPTLESAVWFLSEDGHQAYLAADTLGAKVRYFWNYLREIGPRTADDVLYRVAYIMADSMDHGDGRFAGWPSILQESVNPFIKLVTEGMLQPAKEMFEAFEIARWRDFHDRRDDKQIEYVCHRWITDQLLCALLGISPSRQVAYGDLQDITAPDCDLYLYRIEREIIWLFGGDTLTGPYSLREVSCEPFREQQDHIPELSTTGLQERLQHVARRCGDNTAAARKTAAARRKKLSIGKVIVTLLLALLACFFIGKAMSTYAANNAPEPDIGNGWDCLRAMMDSSGSTEEWVTERFRFESEGTLDGAPCYIWRSFEAPSYCYCVTMDPPRQVWEILPDVSSTLLWSE